MQLSGGYVFILLQNARPSKVPDPYAQLCLGNQQEVTNVQMRTSDPVWERGFTFLVNNPDSDSLFIKVKHRVVFDVISLDRFVKHLY
jgi:Ca2+-dependent lipid-binding protein, contains C2 domain